MKQNKIITALTLILVLSLSVFGSFTTTEAKSAPSANGYIQLIGYDKDGYIDWSSSQYIYVGENMEESETVSKTSVPSIPLP